MAEVTAVRFGGSGVEMREVKAKRAVPSAS
jgi:hypothetical protein